MTTERLQEFAVLSSTLNYSNASQILFITQSTLSRHISEMEEELGFQLFKRTTRNVELTEAGKHFSFHISKLLKKYDSALSRLYIKGVKASGTIKILYTSSAPLPNFLDFCKRFTAKYPGITLELVMPEGYGINHMDECDLYFTPAQYDVPKNIHMLQVFQQAAYLYLPPSEALPDSQNISLSTLKGLTLFIPTNDSEINGPYSRNSRLAQQAVGGDLKIVEVKSCFAGLVNVSLGQGAIILPRSHITEEYRNYPCTKLLEPGCNFDINVYYDVQRLSPPSALFLTELLPEQIIEYNNLEN